jgi:hypothetical protein
MTSRDAEDRQMQTRTTTDQGQTARLVGFIGGALITAILVVAVVGATLGLGFEGAGDAERLLPPPATLGQ